MPEPPIVVAPMVVHCSSLLRERLASREGASGLLVGCGGGQEVMYLRRALNSKRVLGLDVGARFSPEARAERCVVRGNASGLPFKSEAFDFVAAFHSLEHVGEPCTALDEVARVLRPGAWFHLGVPNKSRLVGYVGSFDASTWQKIAWNLTDWRARLRGRFQNEAGAHAGFDREELADLLGSRFSKVQFLTEDYIRFKYSGHLPKALLNLFLAPWFIKYSAPAHYALCQKG